MDGGMDGQEDRCMDGWRDRGMDGKVDRCMDGWGIEVWMDRKIDAWIDGWIYRRLGWTGR